MMGVEDLPIVEAEDRFDEICHVTDLIRSPGEEGVFLDDLAWFLDGTLSVIAFTDDWNPSFIRERQAEMKARFGRWIGNVHYSDASYHISTAYQFLDELDPGMPANRIVADAEECVVTNIRETLPANSLRYDSEGHDSGSYLEHRMQFE